MFVTLFSVVLTSLFKRWRLFSPPIYLAKVVTLSLSLKQCLFVSREMHSRKDVLEVIYVRQVCHMHRPWRTLQLIDWLANYRQSA